MSKRIYQANSAKNLSQQLRVSRSVFYPLVAWVGVKSERGESGFHDFGLTADQARDLAQQLLAIAAPEGAETTVTVGLRQQTMTRVVRAATPPIVLCDPHRASCQLRYNRKTGKIDWRYDGGRWYTDDDARDYTESDIGTPTPERRAIWDALIANGGSDEVTEVVVIDNAPEGVSGASFLKSGGVK